MLLTRISQAGVLAGLVATLGAAAVVSAGEAPGRARISAGRIVRTAYDATEPSADLPQAAPAQVAPAQVAARLDGSSNEAVEGDVVVDGMPGCSRGWHSPYRGYTYFTTIPKIPCSPWECHWQREYLRFRARNAATSAAIGRHLRCANPLGRLAYWDFGWRQDVIAVDPGYSHPADHDAYAAQGYGIPMAVPLAPIVRGQYNYSWGSPASRITPISNVSYYRRYRTTPW